MSTVCVSSLTLYYLPILFTFHTIPGAVNVVGWLGLIRRRALVSVNASDRSSAQSDTGGRASPTPANSGHFLAGNTTDVLVLVTADRSVVGP